MDAADNVLAAGGIIKSGTNTTFTVVKLDSTSETEVWRQVVARGCRLDVAKQFAIALTIPFAPSHLDAASDVPQMLTSNFARQRTHGCALAQSQDA